MKTIEDEKIFMNNNQASDLVDISKGQRKIENKLFNIKRNVNGSINSYKAHIIVKCNMQKKVGYDETLSLIIKMISA